MNHMVNQLFEASLQARLKAQDPDAQAASQLQNQYLKNMVTGEATDNAARVTKYIDSADDNYSNQIEALAGKLSKATEDGNQVLISFYTAEIALKQDRRTATAARFQALDNQSK